jgi:hypothetical protein
MIANQQSNIKLSYTQSMVRNMVIGKIRNPELPLREAQHQSKYFFGPAFFVKLGHTPHDNWCVATKEFKTVWKEIATLIPVKEG